MVNTSLTGYSPVMVQNTGQGGLYVCTHLDALANEYLNFAIDKAKNMEDGWHLLPTNPETGLPLFRNVLAKRANDFPERFVASLVTRKKLWVADLSNDSPDTNRFFDEIQRSQPVQDALGELGYNLGPGSLARAVKHDTDYSAARAIGLAVASSMPLIDGIQYGSAREHFARIGETNDNLVLFGVDGEPHPSVKVTKMHLYTGDSADGLLPGMVHETYPVESPH